jgi:hypothetical protein
MSPTGPPDVPTSSVTSFPRFTHLPAELRLHIWELLLPAPRIVYIRELERGNENNPVFQEAHNVDTNMQSSQEAGRYHILKYGPDFNPFEMDEWGPGWSEQRPEESVRLFMEDEDSDVDPDVGDIATLSDEDTDDDSDMDEEDAEDEDEDLKKSNNDRLTDLQSTPEVVGDTAGSTQDAVQAHGPESPDRNPPGSDSEPEEISPIDQKPWYFKSYLPPPSILLQVCRESAGVVRRHYPKFFKTAQSPGETYFNFSKDVLYLDRATFLARFLEQQAANISPLRYDLSNMSEDDTFEVQQLALNWEDWYRREEALLDVLLMFPNVGSITFVTNFLELDANLRDLVFVQICFLEKERNIYTSFRYVDDDSWSHDQLMYIRYGRDFNARDLRYHLRRHLKALAGGCRSFNIPYVSVKTISEWAVERQIDAEAQTCWEELRQDYASLRRPQRFAMRDFALQMRQMTVDVGLSPPMLESIEQAMGYIKF